VATHTRLIFLPRLNILRKWEDFTIFAPCRQSLCSRSSLPRMLIKVVFMKDRQANVFLKKLSSKVATAKYAIESPTLVVLMEDVKKGLF
jgi:hypothetical protein